MTGYAEAYRRSLERPEEFGRKRPRRSIGPLGPGARREPPPFYRWFAGARLNACWNALERHIAAGRGANARH